MFNVPSISSKILTFISMIQSPWMTQNMLFKQIMGKQDISANNLWEHGDLFDKTIILYI